MAKILEIGVTIGYGYVIQPDCKWVYHFIDDESHKGKLVRVIKQSDNLEELIDFYIAVDNFGKPHYCDGYIPLTSLNILFKGMKSVKGLTITESEINVVAKLNDKGELELL